MSSEITDVLGSFSVAQLRDLTIAMSSRGIESPKRISDKEELLAFWKNKKTDQALALFAHRIEAVTPYKHVFLYSIDASKLGNSHISIGPWPTGEKTDKYLRCANRIEVRAAIQEFSAWVRRIPEGDPKLL